MEPFDDALRDLIGEYRSGTDDDVLIAALGSEAERLRNASSNRGLEEFSDA